MDYIISRLFVKLKVKAGPFDGVTCQRQAQHVKHLVGAACSSRAGLQTHQEHVLFTLPWLDLDALDERPQVV